MKLTFDYYHNLEQVDLFLCNPDGRELFPLPGKSRNLTLRFNDLSELTFEVDSKITLSNNTVVELEAYDYIQTKRLVYATNIGWFQISGVDEHDNGVVKYKAVKAESYQSVFKNKGFISEERVYCFYNPNDPHDDHYDSTKEDSIPSVLGQWNKQLGVKQDLGQGLSEPETPYGDWTVTYINSGLIYAGAGSKCRTFKESITYGYDWMVNDVEEAFEVVVLFDFMYKTIHVMAPSEVAQRVNVIYTFNNFMRSVNINEAAEDIVTVLNCNGTNCDITAVNPTGTNYICDFSYFMDKANYRWMSSDLIAKLEAWKATCDAEKDSYTSYVTQLRSLWFQKTQCNTSLQEMSLSLQDLKDAQNKRSVVGSGTPGALCGIVAAEHVQSGKTSIKSGTDYYSTPFTGSKTVTAYQFSPSYDANTRKWVFSGASKSGTADSIVADNLSDDNTSGVSYWYFSDASDGSSYCKLQSATTVNKDSETSSYYCGGFDRYIAYSYPTVDQRTGKTIYTDSVQEWINLREELVTSLNIILYGYGYETDNPTESSISGQIKFISACLDAISSRLNILSYFADTPTLLRELNCYWIEGDYTNDNIAVLKETTPEEEIDLSNELLNAGYIELSKVCQPHFSFSLDSVNATKQYEFRDQMRLLELGKIITIEKEEGLWYYPALLEISMNLDNSDEFSMTFANATRLDDWGYTYADLISDASSTSRKVSANWQDILAYAKERETVTALIRDPLDMTLRAAFANMVNQEFAVDKNGILGRKKLSETSDEFEDEQVRLINNLLIFTDDNWETAKTALGKIYYTDEDGNQVASYGLIAETIIGSLIMGERLKINNATSTVELGAEGITIKKSDGTVVFQATPSGELVVRNYASQSSLDSLSGEVGGIEGRVTNAETSIKANTEQIELKANKDTVDGLGNRLSSAESEIKQNASEISAKVSETYGDSSSAFGWSLTPNGFQVYSNASTVMNVTSTGLEVTGKITATDGRIGGCHIVNGELSIDSANIKSGVIDVARIPNLTADKIIGSLILGETLKIRNGNSSIIIDETGIAIVKKVTNADGSTTDVTVFNASSDGTLYVGNYATEASVKSAIELAEGGINAYVKSDTMASTLEGYATKESVKSAIELAAGGINAYVAASGGNQSSFGWSLTSSGFYLSSNGRTVMEVTSSDFVTRHITLGAGTIGRWSFGSDYITPGDSTFTYLSSANSKQEVSFTTTSLKTSMNRGGDSTNTSSAVSAWYSVAMAGKNYENGASDSRLKNSVEPLPKQYDLLFDSILPRRYKYNDGESGRYHTGFVAQEVVGALEHSGLTTKDFAAVCLDGASEDDGIWYLRRDEFVALNTWQIQLLKRRVSELESMVAKLQER